MRYSNNTTKALGVISGRAGKSVDLLRQQYGGPGASDAEIIDRIQKELGFGDISWFTGAPPIGTSERAWLRSNAFRVNETGRMVRGEHRVMLPLQDDAGHIRGILGYDASSFRRGDDLTDEDQRYALSAFGGRVDAAEPECVFYRRSAQ